MSELKTLLAQREALEAQIKAVHNAERSMALTKCRMLMKEWEITPEELAHEAPRIKSGTAGSKVAPKYRDPSTGKTWTGRGKTPKWIEGKNLDDLRI